VACPEVGHQLTVGGRSIGSAVVGQDPLDPDADLGDLVRRDLQGGDGAGCGVVGDRHDNGVATGVVDDDLKVLIAGVAVAVVGSLKTTERPPAATGRDPTQLLVVLVEKRTRMTGDVADRGGGHLVGVAEAAEAAPSEDPMDSRGRPPEERSKAIRPVSPGGPGSEDLSLGVIAQATWRVMRPGGSIE
jgi:hypothetical protein